MPVSKVEGYIKQRVAGVDPLTACLSSGYSQAGISVTMARLESREDVRKAIRAGKRGGGVDKVTEKSSIDAWKLKSRYDQPLDLLRDVMNNPDAPSGLRIQCAKDALPYCHARKETSKKEDANATAKKVGATSKFGTMPSPIRRVS